MEHLYQAPEIFASYREHIGILELLAASRLHNQSVFLYVSPLHVSAAFGQLTLFNDILQRVENKFPLDALGWSTLHYAAINDSLNIYESIVAINGNIFPHSTTNSLIIGRNSRPLNMAVKDNSLKICRFIVENNQVPSIYSNISSVVEF